MLVVAIVSNSQLGGVVKIMGMAAVNVDCKYLLVHGTVDTANRLGVLFILLALEIVN